MPDVTHFAPPRRMALLLAATVALLAPRAADAGGLSRPNPLGPRSVGMGGAFTAVADDPTALHFNPAGLGRITTSMAMFGAELIHAPRTYTPQFDDGRCDVPDPPEVCQKQSPSAGVLPLPVLGWATRFDVEGVPSRFAFGVGVWNSYGGAVSYERFENDDIPALNASTNAIVEVVPGFAYQVNDVLSIGAAFRLGFGIFSVDTTAKPSDSDLSGNGFGAGATLGIMVSPSDSVSIGAVYRTQITNKITGNGTLDTGTNVLDIDLELEQRWPQSAGISVAVSPIDRLMLAIQLDWTDWSRLNDLNITFPGTENLNQRFILDWNDNYAIRAGAVFDVNDRVTLRGGYTFDSSAVPDRTIERQFLDTDKNLYSIGLSWLMTESMRLDTAFDVGPGDPRTVEDNSDELGDWSNVPLGRVSPATHANAAPGEHKGQLFTLQLAVQYLY